jgi:hypothetical protein
LSSYGHGFDAVLAGVDWIKQVAHDISPGATATYLAAADNFKAEFKQLIKDYALEDAASRVIPDRIAKGMPIITAGIASAIGAFKKEDYMTGSAALMSICSGTAILLPPPTGPAVGAFFGLIGQILGYCVLQEPSLEDKIEKLLRDLKDEQNKETITAVGHSIGSYTTSLITRCWGTKSSKGIGDILAMPLTSEKEADDFLVEMIGLKWGLEKDNVTFDVPRFANWEVAGYLENQANQRTEGWPEVLGIWCRTYIDLLTANTMLSCLADPQTLDRLINETRPDKQSLPNLNEHTKRDCHRALLNLKSLAKSLSESWESDKKEMLKVVQAVRPAARERGMYVHIGYRDDGSLYTASGSGNKDALRWDYKAGRPRLNGISIHIPAAEKDSFAPKYEVFTCGGDIGGGAIGRHTLDSVKNTLSDLRVVLASPMPGPNERFLAVSAMALHDKSSLNRYVGGVYQPTTLVSLLIENTHDKINYVDLYVMVDNSSTKLLSFEERPVLAGAKDVRSLYLPPTTLPDDPDADAMAADAKAGDLTQPQGPPLLAQITNIVYAGVRDGNKIHVMACDIHGSGGDSVKYTGTEVITYENNTSKRLFGTVQGPQWTSYNGIEVDPYYLWVFGKAGIACATHTSIIKCRQGKIARPEWIYHEEEHREVTSLCPCADGTLVANIAGNIYTADYEIERPVHWAQSFKPGRIVTSPWVKRGGNAKQVIKKPIPCWSMLESLTKKL